MRADLKYTTYFCTPRFGGDPGPIFSFQSIIMKSEQQRLEELKAVLEKEHNRPITDEEVTQAYQLVKLLAEATVKNAFY